MGQKFVVVRKIPNDFRITVSDFDIFSLGLGLVIDTKTFLVSVSSLRLRHFESRSRH